MTPEPFNPYAPPETTRPRTGGTERWRRWLEGVARAVGVILGFSLVADPTSLPGITSALGQAVGGYVFARGVGLVLLGVAFLPWQWTNRPNRVVPTRDPGTEIEEL